MTPKNPYAPTSTKENRSGAKEKVLLALSSRAVLSRLAVVFLKENHEVSVVHFRFGEFCNKLLGWQEWTSSEETQIQAWCSEKGVEFHVVDLSKEATEFLQALALSNLAQCWRPNLAAFFQSQFLLPQLLVQAENKSIAKISTGHRARTSQEKDGGFSLWRSKDLDEDQSYLLSLAPKAIFSKLLLPLGHTKMQELEKLSKQHALCDAKLKSEELISEEKRRASWKETLSILDTKALSRVKAKGYVIDESRHVLGEHAGLLYAEVGSTESLGHLNLNPDFRILGVDLMKHWLIVGSKARLNRKLCVSTRVNWSLEWPRLDRDCDLELLIHPTQKTYPVRARLLLDSMLQLSLREGEASFEAKVGDSLSIYRGSLCLGGMQVLETFL